VLVKQIYYQLQTVGEVHDMSGRSFSLFEGFKRGLLQHEIYPILSGIHPMCGPISLGDQLVVQVAMVSLAYFVELQGTLRFGSKIRLTGATVCFDLQG
jgi:hypothetical protein